MRPGKWTSRAAEAHISPMKKYFVLETLTAEE
jgi:hypothetical protein